MKFKIFFCTIIVMLLVFSGCSNAPITVQEGKYYLDGKEDNPYIEIISGNKLRFINVDLSDMVDEALAKKSSKEFAAVLKETEEMLKNNTPYTVNDRLDRILVEISLDEVVGQGLPYDPNNNILEFRGDDFILIKPLS